MNDIVITIEPISRELVETYNYSSMGRGQSGVEAINWVFYQNKMPFSVARYHGEIVGVSGYIQSNMSLGRTTGVTFQAIDSFVSENMRGKGIFTKLAIAYEEYATQIGADLFWGFPNINAAPAWFSKLNCKTTAKFHS